MPLVHLLVPQLLRKAQDLEAQIGPPGAPPPAPLATGYLQAGYEKTPYDPRGLMDKPPAKPFDSTSNSPGDRELTAMGQLQRSENPYTQDFARSYLNARLNDRPAELLPTSPAAPMKLVKKGDKVGTKGRVLPFKSTDTVGVNEQGEATDMRGRPSKGYLYTPSIETPSGSTPMRNPDRKAPSVMIGDADKFSNDVFAREYGPHLKAMQENRDANGMPTDQFPPDYFKGMNATERSNIIKGVEELRRRQKLAEEGTPI